MESIRYLYRIGNGPSSSHTIGPAKAVEVIKSYYSNIEKVEVTLYGSLAYTGKGHLTDVVIKENFFPIPTEIIFNYRDEVDFPNTMDVKIYLPNKEVKNHRVLSLGGGKISIDGRNLIDEKEVYKEKNFEEIRKYCESHHISLSDYVYEKEGIEIKDYLKEVYEVMMDSIDRGLKAEGYLPGTLHIKRKASYFLKQKNDKEVEESESFRLLSAYAFAVGEENASGHKIVTSPTCGAAGVVPSVIKYFSNKLNSSLDEIIDALAVAGLIGNIVKTNGTISGAEGGCQAEIGTATAMAASCLCTLKKLNINQIESASEIAIEHSLGLTCDPIGGYVQIPCIERNAVASLKAVNACYIAEYIADMHYVSFDKAVETALETGRDMNSRYKETGQGGLADKYKTNC